MMRVNLALLVSLFASLTAGTAKTTADVVLYANDTQGPTVYRIDANGDTTPYVTLPGPNQSARAFTFNPSGELFVLSNLGIYKYSPGGQYLGKFSDGGGIGSPAGLIADPSGNLYDNGPQVFKILPTGQSAGQFASGINGMAFDPQGNLYTFATNIPPGQGSAIDKYSGTGQYLGRFATLTDGGSFQDITFDRSGNLYVSYYGSSDKGGQPYVGGLVWEYSPTGQSLGEFARTGHDFNAEGMTFDPAGNLLVAAINGTSGHIEKFTATGQDLGQFAMFRGGGQDYIHVGPSLAVPEPSSLTVATVVGFVGLAGLWLRPSRP